MADINEILLLIKTTRKNKRITQKQVASYLGIPEVNYMRIENGETSMKLETYIDICKFLGVNLFADKSEEKETSLITNKETDINSLSSEIRSTNKKIDNIEDKLEEILKIFKNSKKR